MNPDARVLDWKSAANGSADDANPLGDWGTLEALEAFRIEAGRKVMAEDLLRELIGTSLDPHIAVQPELPRCRAEVRAVMAERKEAERKAQIKAMPIKTKTFEC
jgi:hypothetical protein